ncbi:MAG: hypothetical protein GX138_04550 [Firmicutes bacterium]|jgi:quercetin dioxygenase-like cupin family protein|nr:hypothetical protein [Bacillota bacterium]
MDIKVFELSGRDGAERVIKPIIKDENLHYMHMVLPKGTGLPVHFTNAVVYMTVNKGTLSISLADGEFKIYPSGSILQLPYMVKMDARNGGEDVLELIVIKAPAPSENPIMA